MNKNTSLPTKERNIRMYQHNHETETEIIMGCKNAEREGSEMSAVKETELEWYDDRVKTVNSKAMENPHSSADTDNDEWVELLADEKEYEYDTPKKIYGYLNRHVWKQDEAKKAAAIIVYKCLRGIRDNAMFIGPTGCGKTYIWRCLKEVFPDRIEIVDGSSITQDGWKGTTKWKDLLKFPAALQNKGAILVVDEADKMLAPKFSNYENVSHHIQAEALKMMEGSSVQIESGDVTYRVDTSQISFVLCGAFSGKAHDKANRCCEKQIGFGSVVNADVKPYENPLTEQDLIGFGVMPEFLGRIQRLVSLKPMSMEDYYEMISSAGSVLRRIERHYNAEIRLSPERQHELATQAYHSGLGIRGMENRIRRLVDDALFERCDTREFSF